MEEKKELNEFLLGDDNKSSSKAKKTFLMIIIAIVIILVLLVVFWKVTREEPKEQPMETDSSIQKMDDSMLNNEGHFDNENFENMPIDDMSKTDEENKFDKIVQDIKAKQLAASTDKAVNQDDVTKEETIATPVEKEKQDSVNLQNQKPETIKKNNSPAKTPVLKENKPQKQAPVKPKQITTPKAKNGSVASKGHYLQVGVFNKTPNKEFLSKISKFNYRIQTSTLNGQNVTKYLIGPYTSKAEANKDLLKVTGAFTKPIQVEVK